MKTLTAVLLALVLTACGGGGTEEAEPVAVVNPEPEFTILSAPLARCNGTPTKAVIYVGTGAFPDLEALPDACVAATDSTNPAQINALIDETRANVRAPRAYLIA
jgi:hypothetical protein